MAPLLSFLCCLIFAVFVVVWIKMIAGWMIKVIRDFRDGGEEPVQEPGRPWCDMCNDYHKGILDED